jgi:hypothetical protein
MLGLARTQTFTPSTLRQPTQNQSLAKHNRKSSQLAENNHRRPKSIASFCRVFPKFAPPRNSPPLFRSDSTAARPHISLPNSASLGYLGVRRLAAALTSRSSLRRSPRSATRVRPASSATSSFANAQIGSPPLSASRCISARACASIRASAGSCARPPGGGAVMIYASPYSSNRTSVLFPYEMPIRSGVCAKSRAANAFPFSNSTFPFSAFNSSEVKNEKLQH